MSRGGERRRAASRSGARNKLPNFGGDTPLGRPGQPAEIAPLYVLLASAESSYCTGQVLGASDGTGKF